MSLLTKNSTPAERAVGCSFAENFVSQADVELNGGTVSGNPQINRGATFDGTNDYISYVLDGKEFNSDELSIVIEFNPDFEADDDEDHCLMGGGSSDDYWLLKHNANSIRLDLGNTTIGYIPLLDYQSYWNVGSRNVIVVSGTSGNTSVWLNGNVILDEKNTVWTETIIDNMTIGSRHSSKSSFFVGTISNFQVYKSLLTAQDALNFYNNDTYNYRNKAVLDLPMGMAQHDPTNVRSLDVSGNDYHAQFGNGSTPSTYPTKNVKRGYVGDDASYLVVNNAVFDASEDFSVGFLIDWDMSGLKGIFSKRDGAGDGVYVYRYYGNIKLKYNSATCVADVEKGVSTVVFTCDTSGNAISYVNGIAQNTLNISGITITLTSQKIFLGCFANADTPLSIFTDNQKLLSTYVQTGIMTPLQVADYHITMMKKINDV